MLFVSHALSSLIHLGRDPCVLLTLLIVQSTHSYGGSSKPPFLNMNYSCQGQQVLRSSHEMIVTIIFSFLKLAVQIESCQTLWVNEIIWEDLRSVQVIFDLAVVVVSKNVEGDVKAIWGKCEKSAVIILTWPNPKQSASHNRGTNYCWRRSLSTVEVLLHPHSWKPTLGPLYSHLSLNFTIFSVSAFSH